MGLKISLEDVNQTVANGQLGRPHIAHTMIKMGFVESMDEAFDKFLGAGKPAYVDKDRSGCEEAIKMIRGAGGVPVLAHPALLNIDDDRQLDELIRNLIKIGMRGIEVYYPEHSPEQIQHYTELANKYDLLITGGTDFHGSITPKIKMGTGKGTLFIPYKLYEKLASF